MSRRHLVLEGQPILEPNPLKTVTSLGVVSLLVWSVCYTVRYWSGE